MKLHEILSSPAENFIERAYAAIQDGYRKNLGFNVEISLHRRGPDVVELMVLWNHGDRKAGHATQVMAMLTQLADELGVKILLEARPLAYNDDSSTEEEFLKNRLNLSTEDLIKWYTKFGFKIEDENRMVRYPKRLPKI